MRVKYVRTETTQAIFKKKIKDLKKANTKIEWSTLKLLGHGHI